MFNTAVYGEKFINEFTYKNIPFEVVRCPATIWCGTLGYASNCTDEPDIGALLKKYQKLCDIPKVEAANPEWSCAISINYWQEGAAPRGMMFAQQVLTEKQDSNHDVYIMPESLFIRVACTAETAKAAFDKNSCELHELFGVIKDSLDENGYVLGTNGAQEIEIYNYEAGLFYAYVQVMRKEAHGA
ncbi:MAG: hypothetical protein KHW79_00010 [Clostridiales bacterium]|nr:hypothetical protein [Clostridiales bacterium]